LPSPYYNIYTKQVYQ